MTLLCPAARQAAFDTWVKNTLDPTGGPWLTAGLSATGNAPATFAWFNAALTNPQLKLLMQRLCTLAGITPPAGWDAMTRQEKKQWLLDQRAAIRAATGIRIRPFDNDGAWDNPADELAAAGLQVIRPAAP